MASLQDYVFNLGPKVPATDLVITIKDRLAPGVVEDRIRVGGHQPIIHTWAVFP